MTFHRDNGTVNNASNERTSTTTSNRGSISNRNIYDSLRTSGEDIIRYDSYESSQNQGNQNNNNLNTTQLNSTLNASSVETNTPIETDNSSQFGNRPDIKYNDNLRISFVNANGVPQLPSHEKNDAIFQFFHRHSIDILGMTEVNRNWRHLPESHNWHNRTRTWWESSKSSISYNTNDSSSTAFQPGGTITQAINKAAHRVIETGRDKSNLGRWSWIKLQGKNNIKLRVITAYRPCKPSSAGPNTAYSQQERFFDITDRAICPRQAVLSDLGAEITQSKNEGDQIVLLMDCNENVENEMIAAWARQLGLKEGILNLHHQARRQPTYQRGTVPIDGIFISSTLQLEAGGYMEFGDFPSDHRAIWADISYINAFGYKMPDVIKPAMRKLKSNDPIVRNKWIALYKEHLKQYNAFNLQYTCEQMVIENQPIHKILLLQSKINNIKNEARKYADKHCRKFRTGNVAFSPEVQTAGKAIQLWKGVIKKKLRCQYSSSKLSRLAKAVKVDNPLQYSLDEARAKQAEAEAHYYTLKKQSKQIRQTFLQEKAAAMSHESGVDVDNIYQQLVTREKQRDAARHIKATLNKLKGGSVSRVVVPQPDGTTKVLTKKEEIEEACILENERKYSQTEGTPCMTAPLCNILGYLGLTQEADQILEGTFEFPADCHPYTREFFAQMKQVPSAQNNAPTATISTETFKQGWKVMKERTSACSADGLHFGHLKACAQDKELANFEASSCHIPFNTGVSPEHWKKGKIVMIYKRAMVDLITKLRSIVLSEADFNFNTKILGKMTLEHAEKNDLIPKEQYGSRKGKSAIDHAIHKRLTYDIIRQTRRPGGLCSNDARSCFDRMVHSIIMLSYRRLGIPIPPVKCMLETIQQMKFQIRTLYGDSDAFLDGAVRLIPFQGNLQGCGASPCSWVIISAPMLNTLRAADNGAHFVSPISKEHSHTVGYAFVDDTDIMHFNMRNDPEDVNTAMNQLQDTINRWEGVLKITGGAIEPTKTWVYPIAFEFTREGKWKYVKAEDIDFQFTVKDFQEQRQPIEKIPLNQGKETLGVFLAADGSNDTMVEELITKATEWKDLILSGHLDKTKARTALQTTIMKTLEYPLPALTLTQKECDKIMKPVLTAGLLSTNVTRNYPRVVAYGNKAEGGLGINNLYRTGGLGRIAFLQEHLGLQDISGENIRTSIELHKIELGVGRNLFTLPFDLYGHLATETWVKATWQFAQEHNIEIEDKVTSNIQLHREDDVYLMEIFAHYGFTKKELQQINRCRIHMQVTTLADIVTGDGKRITETARHCKRDDTRSSPFDWPIQPRPGPLSRSTWSKALRTCFPSLDDGSLTHSLGNWIITAAYHQWFFKTSTNTLFQRTRQGWVIWKRRRQVQQNDNQSYYLFGRGFFLPPDAARATVKKISRTKVILTGFHVQVIEGRQPIAAKSAPQSRWIDQSTNLPQDFLNEYSHSALLGTLKTVSDGSYLQEEKFGTAAWLIEPREHIHTKGECICPGHPDEQNSYRSELVGILGAIKHNNDICHRAGIRSGKITLGCDGEGALNAIQMEYSVVKSSRKHFDLIYSIRQAIKHSPLQWQFKHVKGHQDDHIAWENLDRWAQLNVMADASAKALLTRCLNSQVDRTPFQQLEIPYQSCSIRWSNQDTEAHIISSKLVKTLQHNISITPIRQYWEKKKKFHSQGRQYIDWEVRSKSHSLLPNNRNQWLSKWLTGFCGVGITLALYNYQSHTKCPRCNEDDEDTEHVIKCHHNAAENTWHKSLQDVRKWILDNNGDATLANAIIDNLQAWRLDTPTLPTPPDDESLRIAILQQEYIGWNGALNGFLAKGWRTYVKSMLERQGSMRSAKKWMTQLQRRLWEIPWEMWTNRNEILHNEGTTLHQQEMLYLEEAIRLEWTSGLGNLPPRYQRLFSGSIDTILNGPYQHQQQWITSVWAARSRCTIDMLQRDTSDLPFYQRWTERHGTDSDEEDEGVED